MVKHRYVIRTLPAPRGRTVAVLRSQPVSDFDRIARSHPEQAAYEARRADLGSWLVGRST